MELTGHFTAREITAREAATGHPVVIKVGVTEAERYWTAQLSQAAPHLFPHLFTVDHLAAQAGRGRFGFLVLERIPYSHIGPAWEGRQTGMLLNTVAHF